MNVTEFNNADGNVIIDDSVKKFQDICNNMVELYTKKNADYGDSFHNACQEVPFYAFGKIYDKFSRLKNLTLNKNSNPNFESLEDTLIDMANYCIMTVMEIRNKKNGSQI